MLCHVFWQTVTNISEELTDSTTTIIIIILMKEA
jgi:hypothetical protein